MHTFGRRNIFTDVAEITYENIIDVLKKAYSVHQINAAEIDYLLRYEKGEQPLQRVKNYRSDINIVDIDNVANEVAEFKIGYCWGNPITIVQRGSNDSGNSFEAEAITLLNENYSAAGIKAKTAELARFVEISGVGYTLVDVNTEYEEGDSYFTLDVLDPRNTFVVKSSLYHDKRPMLGVTYRTDSNGNKYFTCFTKTTRYEICNFKVLNGEVINDDSEISWTHELRSGEKNPLNAIPINEWIRNYDLMGCFERQIEEMDSLNILESDICNATDESVQAIWHCNDVDFPTIIVKDENGNDVEKVVKPKNNDWLQTFTSENGKTPFVTALSSNFDYKGNLSAVESKRSLILQKCNVPMRNSTSGGSSGVAMSDASGWSNAEVEATKQQGIMEDCKMQEVKLVLKAIKLSEYVPAESPLLKLRYSDIQPNIKRQKTYELATKANFIATLLSHGFNGEHIIKTANVFDDPMQVWIDSKENIEKYQASLWANTENSTSNSGEGGIDEKKPDADKLMQDLSDQIERSPALDKSRA